MKKLFGLLSIFICLSAYGITQNSPGIPDSERQYQNFQNLIANPGFENSSNYWTASGGSFTVTTTAANIASGQAAGSWDSSASSQTLSTQAVTIPAGAYGRNAVATCQFKCASGTCTHTIQAYDGTTAYGNTTISSSTSIYKRSFSYFTMPTSGTIRIRIVSVASNEPNLFIDNCYIGPQSSALDMSMGSFGGQTSNSSGAAIVDNQLYMQTADATNPGMVTLKTLSDAGTDGIVITGGVGAVVGTASIAQHVADSTHNGYLSSTDYTSFSSGGGISFGPVGSSPNANGASISSGVITLQPADTSFAGLITAGSQNFSGDKVFNGRLTLGGHLNLSGLALSAPTGSNARVNPGISSGGSFTNGSLISIGSFAAVSTDGDTYIFTNATGNSITIVNNYGSANPGEAIFTPSGADALVENKGTFLLQYNGALSAWTMIGVPSFASANTPSTGVVRDASGNFSAGNVTASVTGHASLDVATSSLGNLTDAGTDGITVTGGTGAIVGTTSLSQHVGDATHNGYLSSTDWNTFNGKQAAGSYVLGASSLTTVGAVPYVSASGTVNQDSADLFLDTTNHRVGVKMPTPAFTLDVGGDINLPDNSVIRSSGNALLSRNSSTSVISLGSGNVGDTLSFITGGSSKVTIGTTGVVNVTQLTASLPVQTDGSKNLISAAIDLSGSQATGVLAAGRFPALTGDITTSAGSLATTAAATQANITTLSKSTGVAVHGTNTNDDAAAGYVGEYVESLTSSATNVPGANNAYADFGSISLTGGDWDVSAIIDLTLNGATVTFMEMGIGTAANNSSTGLIRGVNDLISNDVVNHTGLAIPTYRVSISSGSSPTTIYGKLNVGFSVATPQYTGRLSARRSPH